MGRSFMRMTAIAAALLCVPGLAATASARTVVATTADAGSTVSVNVGDTLLVKMPGHWTLTDDLTPELTLKGAQTHGHGARGRTIFTFSADVAGSASLEVQNAITKSDLSMLINVTADH